MSIVVLTHQMLTHHASIVHAVALSALALALARDPSAVRRDVTLLESQCLVTTSKVSNSGHDKHTVVKRVATRIELAAVV
jgi:hypothetical protein